MLHKRVGHHAADTSTGTRIDAGTAGSGGDGKPGETAVQDMRIGANIDVPVPVEQNVVVPPATERAVACPPTARTDEEIRSILLESDEEEEFQAPESQTVTASVEPPAVIAAIRALSQSRIVALDTGPLASDFAVFMASLVTDREGGAMVRPRNTAHVTLSLSDFRRLHGTGWLNDEIMNPYFALINDRDRKVRELRKASAPTASAAPLLPSTRRKFCFITYFFGRL